MSVTAEKIKKIQIHDDKQIKGFFGDYRFLSNFHIADVYFQGILYPSNENAYQASKTLDIEDRKRIATFSPNDSKKIGRTLELREDWDDVKYKFMLEINFIKYITHKDILEKLILTEDRYLEETNYWGDVYWGVCDGVGENNLGKVLETVRSSLKEFRNVVNS